jgi:hypothetical protein
VTRKMSSERAAALALLGYALAVILLLILVR